MAFCPKCGSQIPEGTNFCNACGSSLTPVAPVDPSDHTANFTTEDISQNKVVAMSAYILGVFGVVIALLAAPQSGYVTFHSRQALKIEILSVLLSFVSLVLCWTLIVPIAAAICVVILFVIRIICFFQVCSGKAKDAPIIKSLPFIN